MYHLIEFRYSSTLDVEIDPRQRLERVRIRRGTRARANAVPHVRETLDRGPVEVADLVWENGAVTRDVPFSLFRFVDEDGA